MSEKATALVLRTTDWSETSRICTLWTREFGRVRVLAKGGRRLKSNFETALDLLTLCGIVFLRKSSGGLDLLTEAQVIQRFPRLRTNLSALYAAYYVAELLADWTEDYDPHPVLFDEALATLRDLGTEGVINGQRLARFELVLLRELGYSPTWTACVACGAMPAQSVSGVEFSSAAGGILCPNCRASHRDRIGLSRDGWEALKMLSESEDAWRSPINAAARTEIRQLLNRYVTYLRGRQPRLLPYLES